ncbi:MAG: hypothetical protein JW807_06270 [Spirochaetes bacterium]|nr:hypothetical protein [Spirochaetota bacterium]
MAGEAIQHKRQDAEDIDFFEYWDSLGFFEFSRTILPPKFLVLFELARVIFSDERLDDAFSALEEISREDREFKPDRKESIHINRLEKIAPLSDRMEIVPFRNIIDLKKALPRELAQDQDIFDVKLLTKTLLVQKHFETEADSFKPISTSRDKKGREATRYEQKFYILLDRSKSMEAKMRTFYSKCIIAEFLRRKYNSRAKIFYRPFDSRAGDLIKVEKQQDFPKLIEEIIYTTTGGKSTNIHEAVLQAISDINYDKEMAKSEILVVTDGISKIEKNELRIKLGDIKLHVLKIGDDIPMPSVNEMEAHLKKEKVSVYADTMDMKIIKQKMDHYKNTGSLDNMTISEKVAFRKILDTSDDMFKDLKEVASKYIEIGDLDPDVLYTLSPEQMEYIQFTLQRFSIIDLKELNMVEKKKLFRQVQFFYQYIQMLIENGNDDNPLLVEAIQTIVQIKRKMLKNPDMVYLFTEKKELTDNKETMKLAKAQAKKMLKQMKLDDRRLTVSEMKKAQVILTMDTGGGSRGQLFMLLLVKLWEWLKKVFSRELREAARAEKKKLAEEKELEKTALDENEM